MMHFSHLPVTTCSLCSNLQCLLGFIRLISLLRWWHRLSILLALSNLNWYFVETLASCVLSVSIVCKVECCVYVCCYCLRCQKKKMRAGKLY